MMQDRKIPLDWVSIEGACAGDEIGRKFWLKPRRNGGQSVRFGGRTGALAARARPGHLMGVFRAAGRDRDRTAGRRAGLPSVRRRLRSVSIRRSLPVPCRSTKGRARERREIKPRNIAAEIVGLYMAPPENAIVLVVDENPSIQALERAQSYLKLPNGRPLTGQRSGGFN
jgi:hypothetical protein